MFEVGEEFVRFCLTRLSRELVNLDARLETLSAVFRWRPLDVVASLHDDTELWL